MDPKHWSYLLLNEKTLKTELNLLDESQKLCSELCLLLGHVLQVLLVNQPLGEDPLHDLLI